MKLKELAPFMICVNLGGREDRRQRAWRHFDDFNLDVHRQPGINRRWVSDPRGFYNSARYACSLAKRLAIRRGKLAGAPAVLLLEDDVTFSPDLEFHLESINLPDDWGIFFLGCKHLSRPSIVGPRLVRVTQAADHHAMVVRSTCYREVLRALAGYGKYAARSIQFSDVKMSGIQSKIPTYAAYPNLAWQLLSHSDNSGVPLTHYDTKGAQRTNLSAVRGLDEEMSTFLV